MGLFIGLDLGGTNLKYALGTRSGELIKKLSRPSMADRDQSTIFKNIYAGIEELLSEAAKQNETVTAIGVGSPGSIHFEKGQLIDSTPNIQSWTDAPIKKNIEARFNITTWADNDANVVALAEARVGAGKGYPNALFLTLGTGIGGGIILNHQLLRGAHHSAAEVGHVIVVFKGRPCNCGNRGCLEAYASAPAMVKRYRRKLKRTGVEYKIADLSTEYIFHKAAMNEDLAKQTIQEACEYLGVGIASIVNVIDPDIVIIGGGVSEAGPEFISCIENEVKKHAIKAIARKLKVIKASLGNDAGVVGAILLAAENAK
ncbi:MAG: ROK family protein [Candidatus Zhuqueibacterota bacterium]